MVKCSQENIKFECFEWRYTDSISLELVGADYAESGKLNFLMMELGMRPEKPSWENYL